MKITREKKILDDIDRYTGIISAKLIGSNDSESEFQIVMQNRLFIFMTTVNNENTNVLENISMACNFMSLYSREF